MGAVKIAYLSLAEAGAFLDAAQGDDLEYLYTVALHVGARRGELLALCWSDVNEANLRIRRSVFRADGRTQFKGTKADEEREVSLTAPMVRALAAQRDQQEFTRKKAGPLWQAAPWDVAWPRDLIFTNATGGPLDLTGVTKGFKRILAKARIDRPEIHLHSARHTVGSLVFQATHDLKIAAAMLGHKQVATTEKYYADTSDEATRAASDEYGQALAGC